MVKDYQKRKYDRKRKRTRPSRRKRVDMNKFNTFLYEETASLDVDAQKGFSPLCPNELPVPNGDTIVDALNNQAKYAKFRVGSKDWHPANAFWIASKEHPQFSPILSPNLLLDNMDVYWNAHCIAGTEGADLLPGLPPVSGYDFMVYKGLERDMHPYGACYHDLKGTRSTGLIEFLKANGVKNVIVGGLALDYCVKSTVFQLAPHFKVLINLAACRAIGDEEMVKNIVVAAFLQHPNVDVVDSLP